MATNFYQYCYNIVTNYEADLVALWKKIQSDVPMYLDIIKTEVPTFFKNYMEIIKHTETWKAIEATVNEIFDIHPVIYEYVLEFYNKVIVKYLSDLSKTANRLLALSKSDIAQNMAIVRKELTRILNNFVKKDTFKMFKNTQLFKTLQNIFYEPTSKAVKFLQDLYKKVIIPTFEDFISFIQNLTEGPTDFVIYFERVKTELPALIMNFVSRIGETQFTQDILAAFPTVAEVVTDLYYKVILLTYYEIDSITRELLSTPLTDSMDVLKRYLPVFNDFVERLSNTQLVAELKVMFPTFMEVAQDFYNLVLLPTAQDVNAFVVEHFSVPLGDIYERRNEYWELVKVEVPALIIRFIQRIPNTQAINLLQTNFDKLSSMVKNRFEEVKAQYPEVYSIGLDFYSKVVKPAIDDVPTLYNKMLGITDPNQLKKFLRNDIRIFFRNIITNTVTTELYNKIIPVLDQLSASYPQIYNIFVKLNKDIRQLKLNDVRSAIDSFLLDNFAMSFSFSAGKLTAVVPLPLSAETVRNSKQFLLEFMESSLDFALQIYKSSLNIVQQIIEFIGFQIINYRPYLQYAFDFVLELPAKISQLFDDFLNNLPLPDDDDDEPFDKLDEMIENFFETPNGKVVEDMLDRLFELIEISYDALSERYPEEMQAFESFLSLCEERLEFYIEQLMYKIIDIMVMFNVYQDLAEGFIETIVEPVVTDIMQHPLVLDMINYFSTLTIEKAQFDLISLFKLAMRSIETIVDAIPKEVTAFISLHTPNFVFEYVNIGFFFFFVLLVIGM